MQAIERHILVSIATSLLIGLSACGGGGGGGGQSTAPPTTTPTPSPTPTPAQFGAKDDLLFWTPAQQQIGYRNMELIFSTRAVSHTTSPAHAVFDLPSAPMDFSSLRYQYLGQTFTLSDFITNENVAGMLVLKDGKILYEHYAFGHSADAKWTSFSVAKSVVSLLFGVAIKDGLIASVNDPVTMYLPQLQGTSYQGVTIKNLLQMTSGVQWNEDYSNPQADVGKIGAVMRDQGTNGLIQYMGALPRLAAPGTRFNYSTGETHLAGALLAAAVKDTLSNYLSKKLWSTFAMESDAFWVTASDNGPEVGGCCISATLRDYARIGQFALRNGTLGDGTQIVPANWIANSTAPESPTVAYGYLWWLLDTGNFAALGIFGQGIEIFPQQRLVIVMQGFWPAASSNDLSSQRASVVNAIRAYVGP